MSYNKYEPDTKTLKKTIVTKYNNLVDEFKDSQEEIASLRNQLNKASKVVTPKLVEKVPEQKTTTISTTGNHIKDIQVLFESSTSGVNDAFAGLTSRLLTKVTSLDEINKSVEAGIKTLNDVYDLKVSLNPSDKEMGLSEALEYLISEYVKLDESFNEKIENIRLEHSEKLVEKTDFFNEKKAERVEFLKETKQADELEVEREVKEYLWEENLKKESRQEEVSKRKAEREKTLLNLKKEFSDKWDKVNLGLNEREDKVLEVEEKFNSLENELKNAFTVAMATSSGAVKKAKEAEAKLVKTQTEGSINKLEIEIEAIEKELVEQNSENNKLEVSVREAQEQCRELATKAIEGASGTKTADKLQELAMELAKSPAKR